MIVTPVAVMTFSLNASLFLQMKLSLAFLPLPELDVRTANIKHIFSPCDPSSVKHTCNITAQQRPGCSIYKHGVPWMICIGLDQSGLEGCGGRLVRTDHLD